MKIYGQLEKAQWEVSNSAPTAKKGAFYYDNDYISGPSPFIYNGSAWERVLTSKDYTVVSILGPTGFGPVTQNIDWSLGSNFKVTLRAHTEFTFSNPEEGRIYELHIIQGTSTAYKFWFPGNAYMGREFMRTYCTERMQGLQHVYRFKYSAVTPSAITTLRWTSSSAPLPAIPNTPTGVAVCPDPKKPILAVSHPTTSPYLQLYALSGGGEVSGLYGAAISGAAIPPGATTDVHWTECGQALVYGSSVSPYLGAVYVTNAGPATTLIPRPAGGNIPANTISAVCHSGVQGAVYSACASSPFIYGHPFDPITGFGTRYVNPGTLPVSTGNDIRMSHDHSHVGLAHSQQPCVVVYPVSGGAFGAQITPTNAVAGGAACDGRALNWSRRGRFLAIGTTVSPYVEIHAWNGVALGARTVPVTPLTGTCVSLKWSMDDRYLFCFHEGGAQTLTVYPIDPTAGTFGAPFYPLVIAANGVHGDLSPDGNNVYFVHSGAAYLARGGLYHYDYSYTGFETVK